MFTFTVHKKAEDKLLLVFRNHGCFNGYNVEGGFTRSNGASFYLEVSKLKKGVALNISERCTDILSDMELIGLAWIDQRVVSREVGGSATHYNIISGGAGGPVYQIFSENNVFCNHDYRRDSKRKLTAKENYWVSWLTHSAGTIPVLGEGLNVNTPFGGFLNSLFSGHPLTCYDLMGSDRSVGFSVAYLMSYRNLFTRLVKPESSIMQSFEDYVKSLMVRKLKDTKDIDTLFALNVIGHSGSDNEIFTHAGPVVTALGIRHGFWQFEQYYKDGTIAQIDRYNKGHQSANLCQSVEYELGKSVSKEVINAFKMHLVKMEFPTYGHGNLLLNPCGNRDLYDIATRFVTDKPYESTMNNAVLSSYLKFVYNTPSIVDSLMSGINNQKEELIKKTTLFTNWVQTSNESRPDGFEAAPQNDI